MNHLLEPRTTPLAGFCDGKEELYGHGNLDLDRRGLVVGWLAGQFLRGGNGFVGDILLGSSVRSLAATVEPSFSVVT